jgi:hypothetical protein
MAFSTVVECCAFWIEGDANIRLTALRSRDARPESSSFSFYLLGKNVVDLLGHRMNDYSDTLDSY